MTINVEITAAVEEAATRSGAAGKNIQDFRVFKLESILKILKETKYLRRMLIENYITNKSG